VREVGRSLTPASQTSTRPLHDALPISIGKSHGRGTMMVRELVKQARELIRRNRSGVLAPEVLTPEGFGSLNARRLIVARVAMAQDRKSTRLNSSHVKSSYAVFCLKKKN